MASALGEMESHHSLGERIGAAASSSILIALLIGTVQAGLLGACGVWGLSIWGVGPGSPLAASAGVYLAIRALAAPAGVLFLTLQGTFRGLGDTKAPFFATVLMNTLNIAAEYVLIWQLGWGVRGAAVAMAAAQVSELLWRPAPTPLPLHEQRGRCLATRARWSRPAPPGVLPAHHPYLAALPYFVQASSAAVLLAILRRRCTLGLVGGAALRETLRFLKPTGLLVLRTLATTATFATATALAARTDAVHAASHQIAFQVWLASSLLADSLAVAAQALMARSLASGDRAAARRVAWRCLGLSLALGLLLMGGLALGQDHIAALFTRDPAVLGCMRTLLPVVVRVGGCLVFSLSSWWHHTDHSRVACTPGGGGCGSVQRALCPLAVLTACRLPTRLPTRLQFCTQPINALAFVMDGILYGVSGFGYAATAMVAAAVPAVAVMVEGTLLAAGQMDLSLLAVWAGLAVFMVMRFATLFIPLVRRQPPFNVLTD